MEPKDASISGISGIEMNTCSARFPFFAQIDIFIESLLPPTPRSMPLAFFP